MDNVNGYVVIEVGSEGEKWPVMVSDVFPFGLDLEEDPDIFLHFWGHQGSSACSFSWVG